MPDEIEPALTPEEWKIGASFTPNGTFRYSIAPEKLSEPARQLILDSDGASVAYPDDLPAIMALANAALPDDDPRKITREDVALLREDGLWFAREARGSYDREAAARNVALAAKLAVLLPPTE